MQSYQCPNCGRIYGDNVFYCYSCNYRLKKKEDIVKVKHPELAEHKVIGTTSPTVICPYCQSTNTTKISNSSDIKMRKSRFWITIKSSKQWHCNICNSDF